MTNYEKITVGNEGRVELHDQLKLTGAEVSINQLPAVRKKRILLMDVLSIQS